MLRLVLNNAMHLDEQSPAFTLQGVFAGFFRDIYGKRRMVLHGADGEVFLKVTKLLRRELASTVAAGQEVVVTGREMFDADSGRTHRFVTGVRPLGSAAPLTCPIRVCTKKHCWRSGGKALWHALEEGIAASPAAEAIRLEGVDCLDHCKRGPNLEWGGQMFHGCTLQQADRILTAIAEPIAH